MHRLSLTKLHGLGNDFLVLIADSVPEGAAALARRVCDRHRGVGADGLLIATTSDAVDADIRMHLFNADGSRAEMSGNGIRCFAQAVARSRGVESLTINVQTDGGLRHLVLTPDPGGDTATSFVRVDMGPARQGPADEVGGEPPTPGVARMQTVDMGNPHLVLLVDDPASVDLAVDGPAWESRFPAGINVHFVRSAPASPDSLEMRVWERGAGVTEACGTGACAAAHVARDWGLVGDSVQVAMPGGAVHVELGESITLNGPTTWIADVSIEVQG